jgi:1,4-alpha-glucan branching enzyme
MRIYSIIWIIALNFLLNSNVFAQSNAIKIDGSYIKLLLDKRTSEKDQKKILEKFNMNRVSLDSLWNFQSLGVYNKEGWKVKRVGKNQITVYKPVVDLSGQLKESSLVSLYQDFQARLQQQTDATFGYNLFGRIQSVKTKNEITTFYLPGHTDSHEVFLSGTFNEWSTLKTPMVPTDSGWIVSLKLKPGKHVYKYIVNGHWLEDPNNNIKEFDYEGGSNSVYYVVNKRFDLKGYETARRVYLTGSFINWEEDKLPMQKTKSGWAIAVYLKEGTHLYKFIVDKNWIIDPTNKFTQADKDGHVNSVFAMGDTLTFELRGFNQAKRVFVAGNFNNWKDGELPMIKKNGVWTYQLIAAPGNYHYKFIVDGNWIRDPNNPLIAEEGGEQNSLKVFKPNHTFFLSKEKAKHEAKVAGNFNGWNGYTMVKTADGYKLDLFIPNKKCIYKFIADGNWILDPANQLWEQNEYGNGNSVVWIQ